MKTAAVVAKPQPKSAPPPQRATPAAKPNVAAKPQTEASLPAFARRREGQPLENSQRHSFESRFRRDFSAVRVHPGAHGKIQELSPNAQAVTVGNDIYLRTHTLAPSAETDALLAHELTHVVQQEYATGAGPPGGDRTHDPLEHEAQRNVVDFRHGRPLTVSRAAPALRPQAEEEQDHGWFYNQAVKLVPSIKPILDRGLFNWIGDRVSEVAASVMEAIRGPLDTIRGIETSISTHVVKLIDWIKKCVAALAKGDCSVLHEGIDAIEQAIDGLTAPAFEALKSAFDKIGKFFNGLWERYGAPLWTKIKDYAGAAWTKIEQFFGWIREKIQPLIDKIIIGWRKVKSWLGIGDDPDSQNGLLPWVERKLEALWEKVKAKLEPFKKPLLVVAGILVMLSPAGPIIAIGLAIGGVIEAIRWIRRTFSVPGGVVSARQMLQQVILPKMISAITGLASALAAKASFILTMLLTVKRNLDNAASAVGDSVVSFLAGPIRFVSGLFESLVTWAQEKLGDFVSWVNSTATKFAGFCLAILDALEEIAHVLRDLMRLPLMLAGRLWKKIPACIRDPFIDFIGIQILGRIPIFQAIAGTPEAWAQTKVEVMAIIRAIFWDFDLIGAMKKTFRLMLRVLNVPMELLMAVLDKMGQAWDTIKNKPADFIKNLFKTIALAFKGFFRRILTHLANGVVGWITAQFEGTNVQLPTSWTDLGQIFSFVASVMGLSLNHVFELMEQKMPREVVQRVRQAVNFLSGAWEWISFLVRGDFAGFWQRIKEKLTNLKEMIIQGVIDWIMENVIGAIMAQLLTTADPTGISETIMLIIDIYRTIKTVVQYMRRILEMVQRMLDGILNIAAGVLQPAADIIEAAMDQGMPAVIGFLANLAGLGNIGEKIREVITKIREKVDAAILWLIDKAKAFVQFVGKGARAAVAGLARLLGIRKEIRAEKETHTLYFVERGPGLVLMVASNPVEFRQFVSTIGSPSLKAQEKAYAIRIVDRIDQLEDETRTTNKDNNDAIVLFLEELANVVRGIMNAAFKRDFQTGPPVYAGQRDGFGRGMRVSLATDQLRGGTIPTATGGLWDDLVIRQKGKANYYIRGHLLNEKLGGPGDTWNNLTPLSRTGNSQHELRAEGIIKPKPGDPPRFFLYSVTPSYGRTLNTALINRINDPANPEIPAVKATKERIVRAERAVPTNMVCSIREVDAQGKSGSGMIDATYTIENDIEQSVPADYQL